MRSFPLVPVVVVSLALCATQAFGQWHDRPASQQPKMVDLNLADVYDGEVLLQAENSRHSTTFNFANSSADLLRGRVTSSWPSQSSIPFVGLGGDDRLSMVSSGQGHQVVWTLSRGEEGQLVGVAESIDVETGRTQRAEAVLKPRVGAADPMASWAGDAVPVMKRDVNVKKMAEERRLAWERSAPPNFQPVERPPLVGKWSAVLRWPDEDPRLTSLDIMTFDGESFTFAMFGRQDANLGTYDKSDGVIAFKWGRQTYRARVFENEQGQWQLDGDYNYGIGTNITAGVKGGQFRAVKLRSGEAPDNRLAPLDPPDTEGTRS